MIAVLLSVAFLVHPTPLVYPKHLPTVRATAHQCRVPKEAYQVDWTLTRREIRAMERFSMCLCGPEGSVDFDARPHRRGGYFMHPSCNRDGWNGRRYTRPR